MVSAAAMASAVSEADAGTSVTAVGAFAFFGGVGDALAVGLAGAVTACFRASCAPCGAASTGGAGAGGVAASSGVSGTTAGAVGSSCGSCARSVCSVGDSGTSVGVGGTSGIAAVSRTASAVAGRRSSKSRTGSLACGVFALATSAGLTESCNGTAGPGGVRDMPSEASTD